MPFKKEKNELVVWQDPEPSRVESFLAKLNDASDNKDEITLPAAIQQQLSSYMSSTLQGVKRLASSNQKRAASLSTILKKGIHPVDIILPVYGNLQIVGPCVKAVLQNSAWPFHLTIIDDASPDPIMADYYARLPQDKVTIIKNKTNKGFAGSVNIGIKATKNPYVCILNSDVLVTAGWLEKMVLAIEADPRNQIVNPVTNNTALIDVPMQEGFSYIDMNRALEATSAHSYPEIMPTGFCFLFKRDILKEVGYLDEGFKKGYGEDSDWWMRVISHARNGEYLRWRAVLADDTYVFHERSSSFSSLGNDEYMALRQAGSSRFHTIWPQFKQWQKTFDIQRVMAPFRTPLPNELSVPENTAYNVAFVVHSTGFCGGMKVIADLANTYLEKNVNVKIVHIKRDPKDKPNPLPELRVAPIVFNSVEEFEKDFKLRVFKSGVVIATTSELIPYVNNVCNQPQTNLRPVLFAQSDDPMIVPDELKEKLTANLKSADFIIAGSGYLAEAFNKNYGKPSAFSVKPGVDTNLFHVRDRSKGDERPTVLFSLIPAPAFKGAARGVATAQALLDLCDKKGKDVRIMAYGVQTVPSVPNITCLGPVTQTYLANFLGTEVDIFCDPAHIHSYGMPAIEAMASGVVPIMWNNGGVQEYTNSKNSHIFPSNAEPKQVAKQMYRYLFENPEQLAAMKEEAAKISQTRAAGVASFIYGLEEKLCLRQAPKRIAIVTPHLRKHGGPTTIIQMANLLQRKGHRVELYSVYPDINSGVAEMCKVPISINWKGMHSSNVLIVNSDNDKNEFFSSFPKASKKIMLKLSHNARFKELEEAGLRYPWDAIVTSTNWLKEVCEKPTEGWNYSPRQAIRIGWFHYGHETFSCPPNMRKYGSLENKLRVGFLAHQHPLKGTQEALNALFPLKQKYGNKLDVIAFGEWPQFAQMKPQWVQYLFTPTRAQMAETMKQLDIWLTASHTEGLGRMALEAMSASCAVILTDTGAEFAESGKNCIVVGRNNIPQMIRSIEKLATNRELFTEIVKNGYETACKFADPEEFISNLDKVIRDVCNS